MKRSVIFASYDSNSTIHEYITTYLAYLSEISDDIVFIADCTFPDSELKKIKEYVSYCRCERHEEYDFGSYKRGLNYLLERDGGVIKSDEVIFCNDSCFCLGSLKDVFAEMEKRECDFWGISGSIQVCKHLQSFFIVFKNKVVNSEVFKTYLNSVRHLDSYMKIVETYETPLLGTLERADFSGASFTKFPDKDVAPTRDPVNLFKQGVPLLKRKSLTKVLSHVIYFKTLRYLYKNFPEHISDILKYYNVKTGIGLWFKMYHKKFLVPVSVVKFSSGWTRLTLFGVPVFFYKQK